MTRRRKSTKADKKSRNRKAARSDAGHDSQSKGTVGDTSIAGGAHLAAADAELLLRRPHRQRAAPIGPPLGEHVEAIVDIDRGYTSSA